jgi:hypothetical protein
MPSALRAGALSGLVRHVQLGLPNPADGKAVQAATMKAAVATAVAKDCTDEAHEWMRRRAVEILGVMKDPAAAKIMIDIVADEKASFAFRCEAARGLGMLPLKQGDPNVGNTTAARHLGELAALVAESSTDRFNELAFLGGAYQADRRRLYEYLQCVQIALTGASRDAKQPSGVRAATPAADAKVATDLVAKIDPLLKEIDPQKDPRNDKFTNEDLANAAGVFADEVRREGLASLTDKPKPKRGAATGDAKSKEAKTETADPDDGKTPPVKPAPPNGLKPPPPPAKTVDPKAQGAKPAP